MKRIHSSRRTALVVLSALCLASCQSTKSGEGAARRQAPVEAWRNERPPALPAPEFQLPTYTRVDLKNGLAVYVAEDHSLPTVNAVVAIRAGSAHENAKDAGLASLTYTLLAQGAAGMTQLELANAFARLGSELSSGSSRDAGTVSSRFLRQHLDAGLALLANVVTKPNFTAPDFDRERARAIDSVRESDGDPSSLASREVAALMFGAEHPYGHDHLGSATSLKALNNARAKKYFQDHFGPKNAALILTGDITLDEAKALAEKHLGKWKGASAVLSPEALAKKYPLPVPQKAPRFSIKDVKDAPQGAIRIGRPAIKAGDPDEAALLVLNAIIGGAFTSRLNLKLREEKGFTYGVNSVVDPRLLEGPFLVMTNVEKSHVGESVKEVLLAFDALQAGVTDDELKAAKDGYTKSLPSLLGLPSMQAFSAVDLFVYARPVEHYAQLRDKVRAVTSDDVKRVAARLLQKDQFAIAIAGDQADVEAQLKAVGLMTP